MLETEGESLGKDNTGQLRARQWFYSIPAGVWTMKLPNDEPLPAYAKTVYCYLWSRASKTATAFPGVRRIADECSISARSAQYAIRDLETAGLLVVTERFQGGRQTTNLYTLETPEDALLRRGAPGAPGEGAHDAGEGCTSCAHGGAGGAPKLDPEELSSVNYNKGGTANESPVAEADAAVVVLDAYKGTGQKDLSLSEASKWCQIHGKEAVLAKIEMLVNELKAGHRINRPKGWLAQALRHNWQPGKDRAATRARREAERTQKVLDDARRAESRRADPSTVRTALDAARAALGLSR